MLRIRKTMTKKHRLKFLTKYQSTQIISLDDLVCYCFGYTVNDIEQDFIKNERSLIIEKIAAEKKAGGCDCVNKNPKGR